MKGRPAAKRDRGCATLRAHDSQDSDSARRCPTMAACQAGPGQTPTCSAGTRGKPASRGRRLAIGHAAGSWALRVHRTAARCSVGRCSESGPLQRVDRASGCHPSRQGGLRSSSGSRRAAPVRGGRCHLWSGRAAREAWPRSRARPFSNHRASVIASGATCGRAAVHAQSALRWLQRPHRSGR
jgi:hypothetical protein